MFCERGMLEWICWLRFVYLFFNYFLEDMFLN